MPATAIAHPIQGLLKYHGFRDRERNIPAHDSISVCTAPSRTRTTVAFDREADEVTVDGEPIDDEGFDRARTVLDLVRERAGVDAGARVVSENTFESNVGLGASASAFAALAHAAAEAADQFGIPLSEVHLALAYHYANPEEMKTVSERHREAMRAAREQAIDPPEMRIG